MWSIKMLTILHNNLLLSVTKSCKGKCSYKNGCTIMLCSRHNFSEKQSDVKRLMFLENFVTKIYLYVIQDCYTYPKYTLLSKVRKIRLQIICKMLSASLPEFYNFK